MAYQRIGIIGLGLLGGSLGMAAKRRGLAKEVAGVARRPETLDLARQRQAIDLGSTEAADVLPGCDLVVLCVPVLTLSALLQRIAPLLAPGAVVTDVGSTKAAIVGVGEGLLPGRFLGGHPMAGSEQAGIEAADPDLFENAVWAFTPGPRAAPAGPLVALASALGARPLVLPPEAHDRAVALTSHVPHLLASALASAVDEMAGVVPEVPLLAAGSFRDATRVAASPAELWRDVCLTNRAAVLEALDRFQARLAEVREALDAGDAPRLERFFAAGRDAKESLQRAKRKAE